MAFLLGTKSKSNASTPTMLKGLRAQTSVYGAVIPIIYGTTRVTGNMGWFGDFLAIPHNSAQSGGGKGFGSGQQSNTSTTYTYEGAGLILICEGPIQSALNVYETKGFARLSNGAATVTLSAGHNTYQAAPVGSTFVADVGVSQNQPYSYTVTDYGNPSGAVTLAGTHKVPMVRVASAPASGQYVCSATGLFTFNAADATAGITANVSWRYSPATLPAGFTQIALNGWSFALGAKGQAPWGYLTAKHPAQALGYSGIAYFFAPQFNLGTEGSMQNFSFEIMSGVTFGGGVMDGNPSLILNDLLTNTFFGAGLPAGMLGNWTQFSNYCLAAGILLSPAIDAQQAASKWVQDILDACNSEVVWSQGVIKVLPYGDTSLAGNGVLYQPATAPVYDLTDDDFLEPLTVTVPTINDINNSVQVEWLNRNNDYNPEITEAKDSGSITLHGLRRASVKQLHGICDPTVAALVADQLLKRSVYIRKTFSFKTDFRYCLLEPMDLVTLTDSNLGLNKTPVRLTSCAESSDGQIDFTAEEFPWGTASPTLYPKQPPSPFVPNTQNYPGSVNTPVIFEPPPRLWRNGATGLGAGGGGEAGEIWFGLSGPLADWGGCEIWWSLDNSNYTRLATVKAPSRMGVLTANLAAAADPDTTDTLAVDLSESFGALTAGSQSDADNLLTLCLLQRAGTPSVQELIAYSAATLTGPNQYSMGSYLRRGVVNTAANSFAIGDYFVRLDGSVLGVTYDAKFIGSTIYFKFLSFNTQGNQLQTLSQVSAFPYAPLGGWLSAQFVPGVNALPNPGFESNAVLTPLGSALPLGPATDHWFNFGQSAAPSSSSVYNSALAVKIDSDSHGGSNALMIGTSGTAIPIFSPVIAQLFVASERYAIKPGDILIASGWVKIDFGTGGLPTGFSLSGASLGIELYDINGTPIGFGASSPNFTSAQPYTFTTTPPYTVPQTLSLSVPKFARVLLTASFLNTNAGVTPDSTHYAKVNFDDIAFLASPMLGDSGAGGVSGVAPAPAAGDAALGKVLTASGAWSVPAPAGVNNQVGAAYTIVSGDAGKLVTHSNAGAIAVTLPLMSARFFYYTKNRGAGNVTITPGGGATIDGAATLVLATGQRAIIVSDGANYFTA